MQSTVKETKAFEILLFLDEAVPFLVLIHLDDVSESSMVWGSRVDESP